MAIDEKAPSEKRPITFHLAAEIPAGASIVSVQAYVSRIATVANIQLAADAAAEAATLTLSADPGKGALLTVNPGSPTAEETFKVTSMAGVVATLSHTVEQAHSSGTTVSYEPGWTDRLLVDDTPTPVGTDVTVWAVNGADGQSYKVSVVCPLDDGTVIEQERVLVVTEHAPLSTKTVQVDETVDLEFGFDAPVALAGQDVASAIAWCSRETSVAAAISVNVAQGDATIQISVHPGIGALLTLNPSGAKQEKLKVTNVSGSGPYVCTVDPTPDFTHDAPEALTFEPGVSARLLASTTATIVGAAKAIVRKRKGAATHTYRLTTLATLEGADAERVQASCHVAVVET